MAGMMEYGIPYNGGTYEIEEKYIQLIKYNGDKNPSASGEWLRSEVLEMGVNDYDIGDDVVMSLLSRLTSDTAVNKQITWGGIKEKSNSMSFYSSHFHVKQTDYITNKKYTTTEFFNPSNGKKITVNTNYDFTNTKFEGPINIGPNISGYGIGISGKIRRELGINPGEIIYFRMVKGN